LSLTQKSNGKFLVSFVQSFSQKQMFILAWMAMGGLFAFMFYNYYRSRTRRNFRPPGERTPPKIRVDARQLAEPNHLPVKRSAEDLVKKR
jgi:hypothetical protein